MSIRVSDQLKKQLAAAAEGLGLSEHDTLRLAMQIGFKHFAAVDHDLAASLIEQSGILPKQAPQPVKHTGPTAQAAVSSTNIMPMPPQHIAAEPSAATPSLPPAQKVSSGSGKPRQKKAR